MAIKRKTVSKKTAKKKTVNTAGSAVPTIRESAQDRIWRAQDDARVLAQAEDVKKDSVRLKAARAQAKRMAKEQEVSLNSIRRVAEGKQ